MVIVMPFVKIREALARQLTGRRSVTSIGRVATERGDRYARQLVAHLGRKVTAAWDDATGIGTITFDSASHVVLTAGREALTITLVCPERRATDLRGVVDRHLTRFGARDAIQVHWETLRG